MSLMGLAQVRLAIDPVPGVPAQCKSNDAASFTESEGKSSPQLDIY
jgi:hypothetical protein